MIEHQKKYCSNTQTLFRQRVQFQFVKLSMSPNTIKQLTANKSTENGEIKCPINGSRVQVKFSLDFNGAKSSTWSKNPIIQKTIDDLIMSKKLVLDKQLKFFKPKHFRPNKMSEDDEKVIKQLIDDVILWMNHRFPDILKPEFATKVGYHVLHSAYWVCPFYEVDSEEFSCLLKICTCGTLWDDYVDSADGFLVDKSQRRPDQLLKSAKLFGKMSNGDIDIESLVEEITSDPSFCEDPFLPMWTGAFANGLLGIRNKLEENREQGANLAQILEYSIQGHLILNSKDFDADSFSEPTFRYYRGVDSGILMYLGVGSLIKGISLSAEAKQSATFRRWTGLLEEMVGQLNDIFGLEKDVLRGEDGGMIMYKMRKGCSLQLALEEEIELLEKYVEDYVKLSEILLKEFKDVDKNVQEMIDAADALMYGNIQVFSHSPMYGLWNRLEITDIMPSSV